MRTLLEKDTGLQYLETMIRYLASVLDEDELSMNQIKEMAEQGPEGLSNQRRPWL
ncbi:MAG: hypothetical protein U5K27_16990 [Desulfotignum sp.]|nr:hypothetical protein [Desulfotignum sp.]